MYVEKEKELMDAMRQNGFELFDGNSDDAYDTLERIFMAFVDYANCVIRMQVMVPIWRNRLRKPMFMILSLSIRILHLVMKKVI